MDEYNLIGSAVDFSSINADQEAAWDGLMSKLGSTQIQQVDDGEHVVSGSMLPCHSDTHNSYFTGQRIHVLKPHSHLSFSSFLNLPM